MKISSGACAVVVASMMAPSSAFQVPHRPSTPWVLRVLTDPTTTPQTAKPKIAKKKTPASGFLKNIPVQTQPRTVEKKQDAPESTPYEQWFANMLGPEVLEEEEEVVAPPLQEVDEGLARQGAWTAYLDEEETGFVYFFNQITGKTQWEAPTITFPELNFPIFQPKPKVEQLLQEEEGLPRPLASQGAWTAYFDADVTNMVYYHNAETGKSLWDKPTPDFPNVRLTTTMRKRILKHQTNKMRKSQQKQQRHVVVEDFWTTTLRKFQDWIRPHDVRVHEKLLQGTETKAPERLNVFEFAQGFIGGLFGVEPKKTLQLPNLMEMFMANDADDLKKTRR